MKKITLLITAFILAIGVQAQVISFEEEEGYELGNIDGQNNWITTGQENGPNVEGQEVTDELSSDGENSFKITPLPEFGPQQGAIIGGFYNLEEPLDPSEANISYDIYIEGEADGLGSEFMLQLTDNAGGYHQAWINFSYDGSILVYEEEGGSLDPIEIGQWEGETWYKIGVNLDGETATFYIDEDEVYTGQNWATAPIDQIRFVHDNYDYSAYLDNLNLNDEDLGIEEFEKYGFTYFTQNNELIMNAETQINQVVLYNILGQKVVDQNVNSTSANIGLGSLNAGVYIAKVSVNGQVQSFKFTVN